MCDIGPFPAVLLDDLEEPATLVKLLGVQDMLRFADPMYFWSNFWHHTRGAGAVAGISWDTFSIAWVFGYDVFDSLVMLGQLVSTSIFTDGDDELVLVSYVEQDEDRIVDRIAVFATSEQFAATVRLFADQIVRYSP